MCESKNRLKNSLLATSEPAGDAALGLGGALLDLAVRGVDLLHRLTASVLTVLLELVLGIGNFLPRFLGLWGAWLAGTSLCSSGLGQNAGW
jgi:hypothetical protein